MKNGTKNYLKFCAVNGVIIFTCVQILNNKIKNDGYEFVRTNKKDDMLDIYKNIIYALVPVLNVIITTAGITYIFHDECYEIFKQSLIDKGKIKKVENIENPKRYIRIK